MQVKAMKLQQFEVLAWVFWASSHRAAGLYEELTRVSRLKGFSVQGLGLGCIWTAEACHKPRHAGAKA